MTAFEPQIAIDGSAPYSGSDDERPTASDFANQPKNGKTWKILKMKHECYEDRALDHLKQSLLYEGGFQMNRPDIAKLFCPQMKNEEDESVYKDRIASAAYVPTFGKLITGLVSNLFSQDLSVMEAADHNDSDTLGDAFTDHLRDFYKEFQNDCDGLGTSLHDFMREVSTQAITHSYHYFGVDYPKGSAANLLEQEQLGLDKPALYEIDSASVYDWQYQDGSDCGFNWIKLLTCEPVQPTPFDPLKQKYCVKTWFVNEEGFAAYECYESEALPEGKKLKDKDVLKKVDEGTTSFKRIPIFFFCLNDGIAVGKKLAPLAAEHFNRTTIENHSTNKACLTVPVVYRGELMPDSGGLPDPTAMGDLQRGRHPRGRVNSKGVVELGSYTQDRFEIVEAEGKALTFIHMQNMDLDEKMHSVVNQMGQSLKQANSKSGKSASSKQEDRRSTEMLLTAIADEIFAITETVFSVIAESRGENIVWDVKGLSSVAQEDRDELTLEAQKLNSIPIPSLTFRKEYHYRLASRLVEGTDQRTLQTIRQEIEDGLEQTDGQMVNAQGLPEKDPALTGQAVSKQSPAVNSPGGSDSQPITLGASGQPAAPEGAHLQTGKHIDGSVVFNQLAEDYKSSDIEFVKHIAWMGPIEVPLTSIDFSNKDNWQASQETDKVDQFAQKMSDDQFSKPIILVNNPSNDNKMMVVDGHHRALAALQNGEAVSAYVGQVGSDHGPWEKLHSKQVGSKQASLQSNQAKQVSNQVNKSEKAVDGKTK
jgi:hypothetical protein